MKRLVYFIVSILLLVSCGKKTQTIELNSPDDLAGHSVATIAGCAYEKDLSSRTDINCQLYNSSSDLLQALLPHRLPKTLCKGCACHSAP